MTSTGQAFSDYFRCPDDIAVLQSADSLASDPVFFRFAGSVCYGHLNRELPKTTAMAEYQEVSPSVVVEGRNITLPFDLAEVTSNLLRERYPSPNGFGGNQDSLVRRLYYLLRPLLPVAVRRHLQRIKLSDWQQIAFPQWPVDTTVQSLMEEVCKVILRAEGVTKIPFIWFWPDGAPSCAILTHDVETKADRDFCQTLIGIDDRFRIKSSYQVVPEHRYDVPRSFLDTIRSSGCEVNVHDLNHDGMLYRDKAEFERRAQKINGYLTEFGAQGFRSAVLYRNLDWYGYLGCSYDMSVPNVAHLDPQRGGCCSVLPYFVGDILELPVTTTQDYTLFHIFNDYSIDLWKRQMELIASRNGLISFIIHPDYVQSSKAQNVYIALLQHLAERRETNKLWITLPREVDAWWRMRSKMILKMENGKWQVKGSGSERARVAYVTVEGGQTRYEFQ